MSESATSRASRRLGTHVDKLSWGLRAVGPLSTLRGAVRMLALRVRRPEYTTVRLRSGPVIEFRYPDQVVPALVVFGDLIDPEYPFLRLISKPDWVVVDAGAAIGQFSVFSALLPCAVVHAYEPSSTNIATLHANLAHNGVANRVQIHQTALSDADGEAAFGTAPNAYLSRLDRPAEVGASELVAVRTLQGELSRLEITRVSVLKVNVAGFEPSVFAGADAVLAAGRVDILIMLIGRDSLPWYAKLAGYGYRLFFFEPKRRALHEVRVSDPGFPDAKPYPARHLIAVHGSAVDRGVLGPVRIVGDPARRP